MTRRRYEPKAPEVEYKAGKYGNKSFRDQEYGKKRHNREQGTLYPKFSHSRTGEAITAYNDADYVVGIMRGLDHGTANSKTAFKNACIEAYKEFLVAGNMKDIVTAQETAFSVVCLNSFLILFDIAYQNLEKELLGNPAESDTQDWDDTHIVNWTENSFTLFVGELERKGLPVPNFIAKMVRELLFVIKVDSEWTQGSSQLPPSWIIPFMPNLLLSEAQVFMYEWAANIAEAKIHMDKFGIKYTAFSRSMIDGAPELKLSDAKVLSYLSMMPIKIVDAGPTSREIYPDYSLVGGTAWTGVKIWFKDSPDEDLLKAMLPLWHAYHATNNQYGGILSATQQEGVQDSVNMIKTYYSNNSTWTSCNAGDVLFIWMLFCAAYKQTNTVNISVTGTYTSGDADVTTWLLGRLNDMKYGTGLTQGTLEGIFLKYMSKAF